MHPTEIAYDYSPRGPWRRSTGAPPSASTSIPHLYHQGVDAAIFARDFADRIYHTHIKDTFVRRDGRAGILGSYLNFGDARRGWEFRSPGHGQIDFGELIRALNDIGYDGPLSVEWEDAGMDREHGARDAAAFCRRIDFAAAGRAFDAAFQPGREGAGQCLSRSAS